MIELNNIEVKFGDFVALQNVNIRIKEGEFFTFLGPSGCGKTTTLRAIAGFVQPSQGSVSVRGRDITNMATEKRNIGMVFQNYALFPTLNVYENIAFGLKVQKKDKASIDKRVRETAAKVELSEDQLSRNVSELSGGQQQRVAIARALIMQPSILCLDEPLSNLDAKLRIQLRNELKNLQKEFGITTIYVTHDQEEALTLSDRIAVFNKGIIEQVGTPQEIYNQSATEFVCNFIGEINTLNKEFVQEIIRQTGHNLSADKQSYVRMERVNIDREDDSAFKTQAKVIDVDYHGFYIDYSLQIGEQLIRSNVINYGQALYNVGDEVSVRIDPKDIMQF
ncbi:MAG: ABC transporter ATP-binding protein [Clostridiales bacterium]|nr:ABC transporter ATP-binding protein [Clostridiales bacterium]